MAQTEFVGDEYSFLIDDDLHLITYNTSGFMRVKHNENQFAEVRFYYWLDNGDPDLVDTEHDIENDIWSFTIRIDENSILEGEEFLEANSLDYDFFEEDGYTYLLIDGLQFNVEYDSNIDPEELVAGSSTDVGEKETSKTGSSGKKPGTKHSDFKLYPNPSTSFINASFFNPNKDVIIFNLIDINGKIIESKTVHSMIGNFNTQFDLSNRNNGIYFIAIEGENRVEKLIKQ